MFLQLYWSPNATLTWDVVWPQWAPTPGILQTTFTYVCIFAKLFFTVWLQIRLWICFYPLVHPSSYGEGGVTPLPGCPIYSDAARYTCLSQNGYGLNFLIRTNIWLISTILMYMVIHGCCFLFFMGGWRTPPICPLVAQCTNPREAIMGGNARWAVPMSMINIHDNFTCYVIPQRHTDVGRCLASMNTDARDFANQIYLQMFAYFPNCVPSFSQFVYKFLWGQSYKVPHGKPLLTKR